MTARVKPVPSVAHSSQTAEGRSSLLAKLKARSGGGSRAVGIDLRGSERRPSGWALLEGAAASTTVLRTDAQLIWETCRHRPAIVGIDAPLGLPAGRCCASDACPCRAFGILRECERLLLRRGIRVFPTLLPSMQQLTVRGIRLAAVLREHGLTVIECYPGAVQDILGIPRKRAGCRAVLQGLRACGITLAPRSRRGHTKPNHDELDAITAALAGYFYLAGDYESLGKAAEGSLILPIIPEPRPPVPEPTPGQAKRPSGHSG